MLSLLVVDDEIIIADGLYQMLQETFQDELVVRRCYSFYEAQRILESNRIDILMTDIEMPDMTGLELHRWASERWPMMRVIYLTGYSDFDYARQALQQQAMAYVLKSEGDQVIVRAIENAIQSIREESSTLLLRSRSERPPVGRVHQLIYHVMHGGSVTTQQLQQAFDESGAPFRTDEELLLGYCYFEGQDSSLQQCIALIEKLNENRLHLLMTEMTSHAMMLICQPGTPEGRSILSSILEAGQLVLEKQNDLLNVCLLDHAIAWNALVQSGEWLLEQVNRISPAAGELLIIRSRQPDAAAPSLSPADEWPEVLDILKRLNECLLTGQRELYFEEEERLWALVDYRHGHRQAVTICNALVMSILHSVSNLPQSSALLGELEHFSTIAALNLQRSQEELHRFADRFFELRGQNRHNRQRTLVTQVNDYISAHMDGDLSLTAIADAVHFHPVYLSRIYKEQAGMSLSDYIAGQRLEVSSSILRATATPISAVAQATGFTSSNYFSRWFRKKTGMTPQEYRDKTQQ